MLLILTSGPMWLGLLGGAAVWALIAGAIMLALGINPSSPQVSQQPPSLVSQVIGAYTPTVKISLIVLWAVVAVILVLYALIVPGRRRKRSSSAKVERQWSREVQRNKIIRVHSTLIVIFVVAACVLALAGFSNELVSYIFKNKNALIAKAGGWGAVLSALGGSIFTAIKASPIGGGDPRESDEPSLPSRIIFAVTPPLVLLVLAVAASWVAHALLGFVADDYLHRFWPLTFATFVGIFLCFCFALYEMKQLMLRSQLWLWSLVLLLLVGASLATDGC